MMSDFFLTQDLASNIVQEVQKLIKEDVLLTDQNGYIVASTDTSRLNKFHEGALKAVVHKKNLLMTKELTEQLQGVRKGIVLPIIINDQVLGVIGITGDPLEIEPYAMLVRRVTELVVQDTVNKINEENHARELEFFIFDWLNTESINESLLNRSQFYNINIYNIERVVLFNMEKSAIQFSYRDLLKSIWSSSKEGLFIRWGQNKLLLLLEQYERDELEAKLNKFEKEIKDLYKLSVSIGVGQSVRFEK